MDFEPTRRSKDLQERLTAFMNERIYPAEQLYREQMNAAANPNFHPPILEELKAEARSRGLWNLFHPHEEWGPGLRTAEYAPLAEIMGRSPLLAPEACNCSTCPDGDRSDQGRCPGHCPPDPRSGNSGARRRWSIR